MVDFVSDVISLNLVIYNIKSNDHGLNLIFVSSVQSGLDFQFVT